jgi:peptidoglycan/LPS O-acetylase OafA/YrhL
MVLLGIPFVLTSQIQIMGDKNPILYFLYFCLGFLLNSGKAYGSAIARGWIYYLFVAVLLEALRQFSLFPPEGALVWMQDILRDLNRYLMVIALLGLGKRWLQNDSILLRTLSEAAFPFYLLHLPVTTLVAYMVVRLQLSLAVKYLLIVVMATLLTYTLYLLFKRIAPLRFMLGMKIKKVHETAYATRGDQHDKQ